ncbi:hypothetical protein [Naasia lichenicola]|uniref:Uncharacterized protein n=1 Tax=Naasia lichenicola TaxID=2565933 RepID=A0A4V3WTF0_9MICO|nr:hypothetical protein [Naasia lichenicola]THG31687.1 hypothetical protein E6C64_06365 [Naasia lichenicola]
MTGSIMGQAYAPPSWGRKEDTVADLGNDEKVNVEKDKTYSPSSERETEVTQADPRSSSTLDDPEVDGEAVKSLPGVGGADDVGEIDVDEEAIRESIARRNGSID